MSETTERLILPFIMPGQAQKELYHNEALVRIDAVLHAAAEEAPVTSPRRGPSRANAGLSPPLLRAHGEDRITL